MAVADKILIVPKSHINIPGDIKSEIAPGIEIVNAACRFKNFIQTLAGNGMPVTDPLLHISRVALLVVSNIGREPYLIGNSPANGHTPRIQEKFLVIILLFGKHVLKNRIYKKIKVLDMHFIEVCRRSVEV